jgi:hypothetical protein
MCSIGPDLLDQTVFINDEEVSVVVLEVLARGSGLAPCAEP